MSTRWTPYLVGAGIGVLSWIVFAVVNHPLGISTPISAASGVCLEPLMGAKGVAANPYWQKTPFRWDYATLFVVGTFLGAGVSAWWGKAMRCEMVPGVWRERFGGSRVGRAVGAFVGGAVIMYGARMAGGCTSGHGISGSLQLALSSWVFFLSLFASGLVTAWVLFRGRGSR